MSTFPGMRRCIAACCVAIALAAHARLATAEPNRIAPPPARPATLVVRPEGAVLLGAARAGTELVAVGERGVIVVSSDDGMHWRQVSAPTSVTLTAVAFATPSTGWAIGHSGIVLKSTDGGATWKTQLDGTRALRIARDAAARDAGPTAAATRTLLTQIGPESPFLTMLFDDAEHGIIAGANGFIFQTVDGGTTWMSLMSRLNNPEGLHYYSLCRSGNDLFLAGEQGRFYRSGDGGRSFARIRLPYDGTFFAVASARAGEFLVGGLRGNVFFSGDGGRHVVRVSSPMPVSISSIAVRSDGSYVLTNQAGAVLAYRRGDRALHLVPTPPLAPLSAVVQAPDGSLTVLGFGGAVRVPASPAAAVVVR